MHPVNGTFAPCRIWASAILRRGRRLGPDRRRGLASKLSRRVGVERGENVLDTSARTDGRCAAAAARLRLPAGSAKARPWRRPGPRHRAPRRVRQTAPTRPDESRSPPQPRRPRRAGRRSARNRRRVRPAAGEKPGRADIGKKADADLRHGEQITVAGDAMRAVHRNADASTHADAVDQRDIGLGIVLDQGVEDVFLAEERQRFVVPAGRPAS